MAERVTTCGQGTTCLTTSQYENDARISMGKVEWWEVVEIEAILGVAQVKKSVIWQGLQAAAVDGASL